MLVAVVLTVPTTAVSAILTDQSTPFLDFFLSARNAALWGHGNGFLAANGRRCARYYLQVGGGVLSAELDARRLVGRGAPVAERVEFDASLEAEEPGRLPSGVGMGLAGDAAIKAQEVCRTAKLVLNWPGRNL
jgi:hypothetical protein